MTPPVQPVRPVDRAKAIAAGYTPEEIDAENARRGVGATPKSPRQQEVADFAKDGSLNGDVGQVAHGMSFGIGDKMIAAGGALAAKLTGDDRSLPDVYHALEKDYKDHRTAYAEAHPGRAIVGQAAGAIASPLGGAIAEGANMVPIAATGAVGRAVRAGVSGAAQGGVAGGLGTEGDFADHVRGALGGAVAGGTMGAVLSGAASGVSAAGDRLSALKARAAVAMGKEPVQLSESDAARQALQTLQRSGKNVGDLRAWDATADPEDVLAEGMGARGPRRLGTAWRQGLQSEPIAKVLDDRAKDEAGIAHARMKALTGSDGENPTQFAARTMAEAKPTFDQGYAEARNQPDVHSPEAANVVGDLFQMHLGKPVLSRAEDVARGFGYTNETTAPTETIKVAQLQALRTALGDKIKEALAKDDGTAAAILGSRKKVIDEVLSAAGGEAQTRADAAFGTAAERGKQYQLGATIQAGGHPEAQDIAGLQGVRAASQDPDALRLGQASEFLKGLERAKSGDAGGTIQRPYRNFAGSKYEIERDAGMFQQPDEFQQARDLAERSNNRFKTRASALQGSSTAERVADDGADAAGNAITSALFSGPAAAIKGGAKALWDGSGRALRGQQLDAEAKVLLAGGHGQMSRKDAITLLDAIAEKLGREGAAQGKVAGTIGGRVAGLIQNR